MAKSIQKIAGGIPTININSDISLGSAVGIALIMIVAADPIGFRDMVRDAFNKFLDARYSVAVDATTMTVKVEPKMG